MSMQSKVPFYSQPLPASYFSNLTAWSNAQVTTYLTAQVVPRMAPNLAFIALTLVMLIAFLLW